MKNKLHHFHIEQPRETKQATSKDHTWIKTRLFKKYFPKYQEELFRPTEDKAITYKIKSSKVIKSFKLSHGLKGRPYWRTLFANKMKTVKNFTYSVETDGQLAEQIKLFSSLKSIDVVLSGLRPNPVQSREKLRHSSFYKACKNIQRLRKLEHLQITQFSAEPNVFFSRINSNRKVLDSLKTLRFTFDWAYVSDAEISKLIDDNVNLLRNVTSLKLSNRLQTSFEVESFQRLGELCSKVSSLSFGFSNRWNSGVKTSFLQVLNGFKAFQQLKTLHLCINDVLTFFKDFELPPSIQDLKLDFFHCLSKEIMHQIDKNFANCSEWFEENGLALRFFENFARVDRLETLELLWNLDSDQEVFQYQNLLIRCLLKRISSPLKRLTVLPRKGTLMNPRLQDLSWLQFIESCEKFAATLQTLRISFLKGIPKFELLAYKNKFPKLSSIQVNADFSRLRNPDLETPGSFLQHLISLGESIARIELSSSINKDVESLLSILKQMGSLEKPNKLEIKLLFSVISLPGMEESRMSCAHGIRELKYNEKEYPTVQKVFFPLFGVTCPSTEFQDFLDLYAKKFKSDDELNKRGR